MAYSLPPDDRDFSKYDEPRLHLEKLLSTNLIEFDISPRIVFPLADHGIRRLGDLVRSNPRDLLKIPQIGVTSLRKIKDFLEHHRLHFGMK